MPTAAFLSAQPSAPLCSGAGPVKGTASAALRCPPGPGRAVPSPGLAGMPGSELGAASAARPPSAGTRACRRALPLTGRRPGKTTGSVCVGRSPRLILRGSFSSDLIWTPALPINHGLTRTIHLPALAFNKIEENWSSSRSQAFLKQSISLPCYGEPREWNFPGYPLGIAGCASPAL